MGRAIADHGLENSEIRRKVVALAQEAETNAIAHADTAVVRLLCLSQHSQQGALAGAIAADDADSIGLTHAE